MFEKIPLVDLNIHFPLRRSNYQQRFASLPYTVHKDSLNAFNANFNLSGTRLRSLLALPIVNTNPDLYSAIQNFIVLDADPDFFTSRKNYTSYMVLYTYSGTGELKYKEQTYKLGPGDGFILDCRKLHEYRTIGEHWEHSVLHFNGGQSGLWYEELDKSQIVCFSCPFQEKYQHYLEEILNNYSTLSVHREYYVSQAISNLLYFILRECEKKMAPIPDTYRYLIKYIESNYQNNLSLEHLSEFAGISKYHLSREFKKYTGFSPVSYISELRITHAKLLLSNTDIPSYKIGQIVGFENEANFIRIFKKHTGKTPGNFRK